MFLQGLMYGSSEMREQAALGIGDLLTYTNGEFLKPFVIQIAGPLIRIAGEKYSPAIKSAILSDLEYVKGCYKM
jgi:hypothetical protein